LAAEHWHCGMASSREPTAMRTFLPLFAATGLMILLVGAAWALPV
jgi:hypothetical protein